MTRLGEANDSTALMLLMRDELVSQVQVLQQGKPCKIAGGDALGARPGYVKVRLEWACDQVAGDLSITLTALFAQAPGHIHFARFNTDQSQSPVEYLFSKRTPRHTIDLSVNEGAGPADKVSSTLLSYTVFGFEHILIGLDHIAFLLALLLLSQRLRDILLIVTGFTLGHSVTLSLTVLGLATPNLMVVEALIGFTIALVAVENVLSGDPRSGTTIAAISAGLLALSVFAAWTQADTLWLTLLGLALFSACYLQLSNSPTRARRLRPLVTTLFGLIHGFGFANVLLEVGLPENAILPALFGFNLGVELGQIAIVATLALTVRLLWTVASRWHGAGNDLLSALLCALGSYWFIQRLFFQG